MPGVSEARFCGGPIRKAHGPRANPHDLRAVFHHQNDVGPGVDHRQDVVPQASLVVGLRGHEEIEGLE